MQDNTMKLPIWRERLLTIAERGKWTEEERRELGSFRTCAIGERHGFPTGIREADFCDSLSPDELQLGYKLYDAVKAKRFDDALECLDAIEELPVPVPVPNGWREIEGDEEAKS